MADKLIISALCHIEGKTNKIPRGDTGDMSAVLMSPFVSKTFLVKYFINWVPSDGNVPLVQIFPEVSKNEEADSCTENILYRRERLPSIVVEPTEHSELESDNARWPKPCSSGSTVEEGEEMGGSVDPTGSSDEGDQQKDVTMEPG